MDFGRRLGGNFSEVRGKQQDRWDLGSRHQEGDGEKVLPFRLGTKVRESEEAQIVRESMFRLFFWYPKKR